MREMMTHAPLSMPANGPACSARSIRLAAAALAVVGSIGVSSAAAGGVNVENAWLRLITKTQPAAGYFTLHNDTDNSVTLIGASSSGCSAIMLHQSKEVNGVDKMMPVKSLAIAPHGSVSFSPGSYHLMCMSPTDEMKVGATVPVTLKFADDHTVVAQFPVKGPGSK